MKYITLFVCIIALAVAFVILYHPKSNTIKLLDQEYARLDTLKQTHSRLFYQLKSSTIGAGNALRILDSIQINRQQLYDCIRKIDSMKTEVENHYYGENVSKSI